MPGPSDTRARIAAQISHSMLAALHRDALEHGDNISAALRRAIEFYLKGPEA